MNSAQIQIAAPPGMKEQARGAGAWRTVRYARKQEQSINFCHPDGSLTMEVEVEE